MPAPNPVLTKICSIMICHLVTIDKTVIWLSSMLWLFIKKLRRRLWKLEVQLQIAVANVVSAGRKVWLNVKYLVIWDPHENLLRLHKLCLLENEVTRFHLIVKWVYTFKVIQSSDFLNLQEFVYCTCVYAFIWLHEKANLHYSHKCTIRPVWFFVYFYTSS